MHPQHADRDMENPGHRKASAPHDATLRQFFLDQIINEMRGNKPQNRRALAKFNLKAGKSQNPYSTYPLKAYAAFFEEAAKVLDRPFLGLELGQNFRLWEIGPVYPLLATAPTLREALAVFLRFQASWQSHTTSSVHQEFGETRYGYAINDMAIWPRVQDAENSTAGLCALIRQLFSERWSPVEICFEHDITGREEPLKRYFRCPVRGNAAANIIVIRDAELDRPMQAWVNSNAPARAVVEMHLFDLMRPPEDDFRPVPERLSQLVDQRLGRESVDLETLADILGIAPRTLRRQLSTFGTSFSEILNRERRKKAEMLLSTGSIKLSQLAAHLGYANQSAFSRAFREWTGEPPLAALRRARHAIGTANAPRAGENETAQP
ncbi:AraC family transcriptional regulator ligand-binding domain-containing protein [Sulfitobacter sp. G21635-S1]|uniref:AraC family transcriptional regulator n=1 Tax=Sulfitobacter sp. G21635-S1 TaxID=3014043 RepID=UPI0022AE7A3A|nr:AraC family transcriptional regulator [Sulfitobacter sp. G21635-S1]MCZ4257034.1 AraC family transcriptional regulator ligand-binding domain-containing protein [Sulfitobacter sp. G21635-S1]